MMQFLREWRNEWGSPLFWVCMVLFVPFVVVLLVFRIQLSYLFLYAMTFWLGFLVGALVAAVLLTAWSFTSAYIGGYR